MAVSLEWRGPHPLAANGPRTPYAHFAAAIAAAEDVGGGRLYAPCCGCMRRAPAAGAAGDGLPGDLRTIPLLLPSEVLNPVLRGRAEDIVDFPREDPEVGPPPDWLAPGERPCAYVGVIDDAVAFANARFRLDADGARRSRIDHLWLQGARFDEAKASRSLPFGRAFDHAALDDAFGRHRLASGALDEEGVYRDPAIRAIDFSRPGGFHNAAAARTHGTAVLDLAAGFDPGCAEARRVPIVAVCLPPEVTSDTLGTLAELHIALAVDRILAHVAARIRQLKRPIPLVINISLALTGGPKDGSSPLDAFLEARTKAWQDDTRSKLTIVVPAGNHRQARTCARLDDAAARSGLTWRLPPDDATPSFVEVWGQRGPSPGDRPSFAFGLAAPGAGAPAFAPAAGFGVYHTLHRDGARIGHLYVDWVAKPGEAEGRERATLALLPTAGDGASIPCGDWRIVLEAGQRAAWPLDAFIQRDDSIPGFRRRGRQSTFVDPAYRSHAPNGRPMLEDETPDGAPAAAVRRAGTISAFGTGAAVEVAAGRLAEPDEDADYSGLPFGKDGRRLQRMVSERSRLLHGLRAAATASGGRCTVIGTSFAAAVLTRARLDAHVRLERRRP